MKFDKAYCKQLDCLVTPYLARELYFDKESELYNQKLNFSCPDITCCTTPLSGVNIYNEKRNKKALHFRTMPHKVHKCAKATEKTSHNPSGTKTGEEEGFKITKYPSEFLLERPKTGNGKSAVEIEEPAVTTGTEPSEYSNTPAPNNRKSIIRTSCLDHLVDCYLNGDEEELKKQPLTINGKTKKFFYFFKKIKYYQDEEGLIYYGEVKEIKKYGKNYAITFKDWPVVGGNDLSVSIYIKNNLIESYRKNKMFRIQIEELMQAKEPVLCFFVGASPAPVKVESKVTFDALKVEISNLDHISFAFS